MGESQGKQERSIQGAAKVQPGPAVLTVSRQTGHELPTSTRGRAVAMATCSYHGLPVQLIESMLPRPAPSTFPPV